MRDGSQTTSTDAGLLPSDLAGRLEANAYRLDEMVDLAGRAVHRRQSEAAAAICQLAAHHAWYNPCGFLADRRLEELIRRLALGPDGPVHGRRGTERQVLHVLTEAYEIGGHTRFASRWMDRDENRSSVVLTQSNLSTPSILSRAVQRSGGKVFHLGHSVPSLIERARTLQCLARSFDVVVVHAHPYDMVPWLAFARDGSSGPPVILENHTDHSFWIGASAANVVSDHRTPGRTLTLGFRGIPARHEALLPLPVDPVPSAPTRSEVRAALSVPDHAVLAVSVASAWKSQPLRGPGLAEAIEPVLLSNPRLHVIAVGPSPDDPRWRSLAGRFEGRVRCLGSVADPNPLFIAADIYLDSAPIGSGTSILEGSMAGLPPVSLFPFSGLASILGANSPGLAEGHSVTSDVDSYARALNDLISDEELRRRTGLRAQESTARFHAVEPWRSALQSLYEQVAETGRIGDLETVERLPSELASLLLEVNDVSAQSSPIGQLIEQHASFMGHEIAASVGPVDGEVGDAISITHRLASRWRNSWRPVDDQPVGAVPADRYVVWVFDGHTPVGPEDIRRMARNLRAGDHLHIVEGGLDAVSLGSLLTEVARLGPVTCELDVGPGIDRRIAEIATGAPTRWVAVAPNGSYELAVAQAHQVRLERNESETVACHPVTGQMLFDSDQLDRRRARWSSHDTLQSWVRRLQRVEPDPREGEKPDPDPMPRRGLCLVAPAGWEEDSGWLASTLLSAIRAGSADCELRLVLALPDAAPSSGLLQKAVQEATSVIGSIGLDPENLPFEVAIGDDTGIDDPGYRWRRRILRADRAPTADWVTRQLRSDA